MCAGSYLILTILNVTGSSYCPYCQAYALIYLNSKKIQLCLAVFKALFTNLETCSYLTKV